VVFFHDGRIFAYPSTSMLLATSAVLHRLQPPGPLITAMSRRSNHLFVDVLSVPDLLTAIDRAEAQLFSGIDYAMSCNTTVSAATSGAVPATASERSTVSAGQPSDADSTVEVTRKPMQPRRDSREESARAYSQLAERVVKRKVHPLSSGCKDAAVQPEDTSADAHGNVVLADADEVATVEPPFAPIAVNGDDSSDPQNTVHRRGEVIDTNSESIVPLPVERKWNSSKQPVRGILSKRSPSPPPPDSARETPSVIPVPSAAFDVANPSSDGIRLTKQLKQRQLKSQGGQPPGTENKTTVRSDPRKGAEARQTVQRQGTSERFQELDARSPTTSQTAATRPREPERRAIPPTASRPDPVKGHLVSAPPQVSRVGSSLKTVPVIRSNKPTSSVRSAPAAATTGDTTGSSRFSLPPGVMLIPGAQSIGVALPNGFRSTSDGIRPVVTMDPRPRVPYSLRQTFADKLFFAFRETGRPEMECVVECMITEQKYGLC
jgi:hypothetical protein